MFGGLKGISLMRVIRITTAAVKGDVQHPILVQLRQQTRPVSLPIPQNCERILQRREGGAGLPGNSDAGAMQTWLLCNMTGLYPVTGQTTFLIHPPWFESLTIGLVTT
jgi:hypothetical protein